MAVDKLVKMSLLAEKKHQETLLFVLQSMKELELENIHDVAKNKEWLEVYFPQNKEQPEKADNHWYDLLSRVQGVCHFLSEQTGKNKKLLRKNVSLLELVDSYDETELKQALEKVECLQKQWTSNEKERADWENKIAWATNWQNVDINSNEDTKWTTTNMARVVNTNWEKLVSFMESQAIFYEISQVTKQETFFSVLFKRSDQSKLLTELANNGSVIEKNPYDQSPKSLLENADKKMREFSDTQQALHKEIQFWKQKLAFFQWSEEIVLAKINQVEAKQKLVCSNHLVIIRGWISGTEIADIQIELAKYLAKEELYFSFESPSEEEIASKVVPVRLKNSQWISPFESLTAMYALPKYDEIDPTPWMAPFYFLFFGMMVADVGYGCLLFIGSSLALYKMHFPENTVRFLKLFQLLSISVIFWGLIYGSAFGAQLPFQLLSPTEDFLTIFMLSLIFGGIQLFTGLFLAAKEHIRKKDYLAAISDGFSWQGLLLGLLLWAGGAFMFPSLLLKETGLILTVLSALLILLVPTIQAKSKVGGFFSGLYDLYGITNYIGDFVSYSRLMALGISGGRIAMAFNMLVGTLPIPIRFSLGIVLIVVLQALNLFLSALSAYVHAARLQFVEFFGKFYEGGGRAFHTFKPEEKYVTIDNKNGGKKHD